MVMPNKNKGSVTVFVLVFSAILSLVVSGIVNMSVMQTKLLRVKTQKAQSFDLAEAGLNYALWFASRFPEDYQDGTGSSGPYVHTVKDESTGNNIGTFELTNSANLQCGKLQWLDVVSVGKANGQHQIEQTVSARIAKPSVAEYSYIINTDVWAGSTRNIVGPYHSNGGVRMDGTNNSTVTSAKTSWTCTYSYGCYPNQVVDGVFGSGPNSNLWRFPVNQIDFNLLSADLSTLRNLAQNSGGLYFGEFTGSAGDDKKGYQLIFKQDGTVDVYKVTDSYGYWGYRAEYKYDYSGSYGWRVERNQIKNKTFLGNYTIPSSCSLIFSEEKLWIEGTLDGKTTVVAGRTSGSYKPEVVLSDDIKYKDSDGSDGLTVFAQSHILIPEYSPYNMELNGIFIAQNGSFGRSYYSYNTRGQLIINGTVVSNDRVGTSWGCPYFCSGYASRINSYDRYLRDAPPPFTPFVSDKVKFVKWEQK